MRGFSLLELMTTLAIFGLVATLSIASLGPLKDRYSHQMAVEVVTGAIARAQLMARESGRCHAVQVYARAGTPRAINTTGERVAILRRATANCGDGGTSSPTTDLVLVESVLLPETNTLKLVYTAAPDATEVEVRPNGRQRKEAKALLQVLGRRQTTSVVMAPMGVICVFDGAVGACP
jgi:prepilin-type N-terminal cleavage/methylation domain-containing protein